MRAAPHRVTAAIVVALVAGVGCSSGGTERAADRVDTRATRRSTTSSSSSSTSTSTTTSTTTAPFNGLRPGSSGPEVSNLQQRLADLHFDVSANGEYNAATTHAVMAFQKMNGLGRDGVAGPITLAKLADPAVATPMVPGGGANRVEVDVARQVLFVYKGNALYRIVSVSTGSGERFCVGGRCATAVTPGGSFRVRGKVGGWQTGELGRLYKPSYFNGNIAIHGALSVPGGPASHGCVRVPMTSADWIYSSLPVGTPVYVVNGPHVPAPFSDTPPPTLPPTLPPTVPTLPPTSTTTSTTSTTTTTTVTTPPAT